VLNKLNSQQREAVRHVSSPLLVLAGAGSGKTGVITSKIAWLIRERGMLPRKITAVTFTNKAAREMRSRVKGLLSGVSSRGLTISTFHTLGLSILRKEFAALDYKPGFSIIDQSDALVILKELMRSEQTSDNKFPEHVLGRISSWKNAFILPQQVTSAIAEGDPVSQAAARIYPAYERQLHACNALDLDDLITKPGVLMKNDPEILYRWREQINYLLVDEYQDTNTAQYELVKMLVGARGNLTVVGDDDQSIYAWRGAEVENLSQLSEDFDDLHVIKLEQNYRSVGRILKAANSVIDNNPHTFKKALWSDLGYGDPIQILEAKDEQHEAERVAATMMQHRFQKGLAYGDYAILYRGNHQARVFEKILREHRIPYFISGGLSFFDRTEVKDVMAYLRLVANHDDDSAFLRIVNTPRRGIGPGTLEKLGKYASEKDISLFSATSHLALDSRITGTQLASLRQFSHWIATTAEAIHSTDMRSSIEQLLDQVSYPDWVRSNSEDEVQTERRLKNVKELLDWLVMNDSEDGEDKTLSDCVANLVLRGILDRSNDEQEGDEVSLMTIHAAKGLEFPHVFVVGLEEGLLPHRSSIDEDNIEEERRLFYVAMTRAQRGLTLSMARVRQRYGETIDCDPSRFLEELPDDDLDWQILGRKISTEEKMSQGNAALDQIRAILG
jgi:ATP-dependent DNA helicase Rep